VSPTLLTLLVMPAVYVLLVRKALSLLAQKFVVAGRQDLAMTNVRLTDKVLTAKEEAAIRYTASTPL
jgi:hypothetical protein